MSGNLKRKIARRLHKWRVAWYRQMLSDAGPGTWRNIHAAQPVRIVGQGRFKIGDDGGAKVVFGWNRSPFYPDGHCYLEARFQSAVIDIGTGTFFNNGCVLIANTTRISIGKNCRIGYGCSFFDSDFHGIHPSERDLPGDSLPDAPVTIGDDVFLGANVIVLKGVSIGDGCVIGAGSVVSRSIPAMSIAAGNPCRTIREIGEWDRIKK